MQYILTREELKKTGEKLLPRVTKLEKYLKQLGAELEKDSGCTHYCSECAIFKFAEKATDKDEFELTEIMCAKYKRAYGK